MTATAAAQFEALRNGPIWPVIAAEVKKPNPVMTTNRPIWVLSFMGLPKMYAACPNYWAEIAMR
mgnify:FL=1